LADKFVLKKVIPSAKTYTFLIGVSSLLVFVIGPWVLEWPGLGLFTIDLLTGAAFTFALLFLYISLRDAETSKIVTLVGGAVPILIIILHFLNEKSAPIKTSYVHS